MQCILCVEVATKHMQASKDKPKSLNIGEVFQYPYNYRSCKHMVSELNN